MMDDQIVDFIRDQFDSVRKDISTLRDSMDRHTTKDEHYWKKVDEAEGQIKLLKWAASAGPVGALIVWLYSKLH